MNILYTGLIAFFIGFVALFLGIITTTDNESKLLRISRIIGITCVAVGMFAFVYSETHLEIECLSHQNASNCEFEKCRMQTALEEEDIDKTIDMNERYEGCLEAIKDYEKLKASKELEVRGI
jgi:hypothetical protein